MEIWSGIAGVIIGWVLGVASDFLRQWRGRKRTARALLDELREVADVLDEHWLAWARSLQMFSSGALDNSVPLPIAHYIFENHYKDAAVEMNREQRRSIQMIHAYVDRININANAHRKFLETLLDPSNGPVTITSAIDEKMRDSVKGMLYLVRVTKFHIWYHFEHPIFPDMNSGTPGHKKFAKYLQRVRQEIDEVERQGRTVDPKRFSEIYVPEFFNSIPDE